MQIPNNSDLWKYIEAETRIDRTTCKVVVYSLIFGRNIVKTARDYKLEIEDLVDIRMAFNDFVKHRKVVRGPAVTVVSDGTRTGMYVDGKLAEDMATIPFCSALMAVGIEPTFMDADRDWLRTQERYPDQLSDVKGTPCEKANC